MLLTSLLCTATFAASPQLVCPPGWMLQGEICVAAPIEPPPAPGYVPAPPSVYVPPPAVYVPPPAVPPAPPAVYVPPPAEVAPVVPAVVPAVPVEPIAPVAPMVPAIQPVEPIAPVVPAVQPVVAPIPTAPQPVVVQPGRPVAQKPLARDYSNRRWFTELAFTYDAKGRRPGGMILFDIPIGRGAHVFSLDLGIGLMGGKVGENTDMLVMQIPFGVSMRFGFGMGFQVIPNLVFMSHLTRVSSSGVSDSGFSFKMGGGLKFHVPFSPSKKAGVNVGVQVLGYNGTAALLSAGITF